VKLYPHLARRSAHGRAGRAFGGLPKKDLDRIYRIYRMEKPAKSIL